MPSILSDGSSTFFSNIGSILSGLAELLLALGAGTGFIIRSRRNARREKLRSETAATLAARETKKTLEEKLERQYTAQLEQYKVQMTQQVEQARSTAVAIEQAHNIQMVQLQAQIRDLQTINTNLLNKILEDHHE